ncbi:peptide-methionine (S)-S-oxide reductase MsrA [Sphingomonas sp.]|uniref:peptide-methionine (S)-S-oxide reductase MsrA n=1 Tax=Sphingomonas sp. TaxID=28214 RepID=UPI003B00B3A6
MRLPVLATAAAAAIGLAVVAAPAAEPVFKAPPAKLDPRSDAPTETAVFAGGCFWGVQGVYSHVKGVKGTVSGYTGGAQKDAEYETVSSGTTGHAESVKVTFDPRVVSYGQLLRIYFSVVADPTRLNAQGPDEGTQYRSALFPQNARQLAVAKAYVAQLSAAHVYARPIVTRIERAQGFYPAETYHQDFYALNPTYPYIVANDRPKVEALKRLYPLSYKA